MKTARYIPILFLALLFLAGCGNEKKVARYYGDAYPLPEHPRPDWEREAWQNLNGTWAFAPDSSDVGETLLWMEEASDSVFTGTITVPFSWASPLSGVGSTNFDVAWYQRDILIPKGGAWRGKRIFLVIGASDYTTTVWVNGKEAGEHEGGYTPFSFDITDLLTRGKTERVVIRVEDKGISDRPVGKQVYGDTKGIWQTIYLEGRSKQHLERVLFSPDPDSQRVMVSVKLAAPAEEDLIFSIAFADSSVETAAETIPAGKDSVVFAVPIPNPHRWTPEDPYLYDVDMGLDSENDMLDQVYSYFGMRTIGKATLPESDDWYVTLNGIPVYLRMALDQSFHPQGFSTFATDDELRGEIERAKALGLNGIRIHVKSDIPRKLYWADRLGLLVMADIPNHAGNPDADAQKNWTATARQQLIRDYNHPSIFSWVLFTESRGLVTENIRGIKVYLPRTRDWVKQQFAWAKALDPTRLIIDNATEKGDHLVTDINAWNNYLPGRQWASYLDGIVKKTHPDSTWNFLDGATQGAAPMLNTESGSVWGYLNGTGDIDISYEYHQMVNEFRRRQRIAGYVFTELHDVINQWDGFYRFDRSLKEFGLDELSPGMTVADFHTDFYLIPGMEFDRTYKPGEKISMPLAVSFMRAAVPDQMTLKYSIHGWDRLGEHHEYATGTSTVTPRPFKVVTLPPLSIAAPATPGLMVVSTQLVASDGSVVHRNFWPFRVASSKPATSASVRDTLRVVIAADPLSSAAAESTLVSIRERNIITERPDAKTTLIRVSPRTFSGTGWSVRQKSAIDSLKVWGAGRGFFEYRFPWPRSIAADAVVTAEFIAEIGSRMIQIKDLATGPVLPQGYENVDRLRIEPGYSPNSYPMTDQKPWPSNAVVTVNGIEATTVSIPDDPADHRGLLSWINQKPGLMSWTLDEPGSYGYRTVVTLTPQMVAAAVRDREVRIRLTVSEATTQSGGLSIYGESTGQYPLDPTIRIVVK